jgi:hypothetical protein
MVVNVGQGCIPAFHEDDDQPRPLLLTELLSALI